MNLDYISNNYFSNLNLYIKLHQFVRHEKGWLEHKTKSNYTLWIIQQGTACLSINSVEYQLKAGDVIFFYPGDTYTAYSNENGCSFLFFIFSIALGSQIDILSGNVHGGIYRYPQLAKKNALAVNEYMIRNFEKGSSILSLYAFFLDYLSELLEHYRPSIAFFNNQTTSDSLLIMDILDYMNKHFTEPVTIAQLALRVNKTEKAFTRFFYDRVGMPPKRYMTEKRMQLAIELLKNEENTITDVAQICGYADVYCFSKAFHRYFGEGPSACRKAFTETKI